MTTISTASLDLTPYTGRWVALSRRSGTVVGVGVTAQDAARSGRHNRPKDGLMTHFVDPNLALAPHLLGLALHLDQADVPVYLVGGAVRDALLGRPSHDLDLVVPHGAISLAFRVADQLGAAAYVLDRERDAARIVPYGNADTDAQEMTIDFSRLRGPDLRADLEDRDFTINAMALPLTDLTLAGLVDPFGGRRDLASGIVHIVSPNAMTRDPLRALRAVRQMFQFGFALTEETRVAVRHAASSLPTVSAERIRDELLKTLSGPTPGHALHQWRALGLLSELLPEVDALAAVEQSPPHHEAVLDHTASVLDAVARVAAAAIDETPHTDTTDAAVQATFAAFRAQIADHLARPIDGGLVGEHLLRLGTLFHDVGKTDTQERDADGRIRFFGHDKVGAELAAHRLRALRVSNEATQAVHHIVAGHMRPLLLADQPSVSSRALYRLCRRVGSNVVDIVLLSLADHLATYGGAHGPWQALLDLCRRLIAFYYERVEAPQQAAPLLNGKQVMDALGMAPGPQIGRILRQVAEARAIGELSTPEEALAYIRALDSTPGNTA